MRKSRLFLNRNFVIDRVDRRVFSSFLENGEMVNGLMYAPEHPTADQDGMRQDVIDLLQELHIPMLRFGGNHFSGYEWKDGIGPKEQRIPRIDPAWGWMDHNQVGLDEYDKWAGKIGAKLMPSVNLGTGTPSDARDMIEYTNHPGGSRYSNLRIQHGHEKPYDYKLWCLGNELDGHWQLGYQSIDNYPLKAEQAGRMMKAIDPDAKLVAVGSSNSGMNTFVDWEYRTLMQAPELFDYVAIHTYYGNHDDTPADFLAQTIDLDYFIRGVIGVFESVEAKLRLDKKFYVSVDEWNVSHHATYNFPLHTYNEERLSIFPPYSMLDVLMVAQQLMTMINHSDRVKVACLSLITSLVWDRTLDYNVLKTTIYYPFQIMNEMSDGYALRQTLETSYYESKYYHCVPMVESASILQDNGDVVVFATNRSEEEMGLELCLSDFGEGMHIVKHTVIHHEDPNAVNTAQDPFRVVPKEKEVPDEGMSVVLEPYSFHAILVRADKPEKTEGADFASVKEAGRPTIWLSGRSSTEAMLM